MIWAATLTTVGRVIRIKEKISMKKPIVIAAALAFTVLLIALAQLTGLINFPFANSSAQQGYRNSGTLELLCEVSASRPVNGLDQPFEITKLTLPAGIDFENSTGWYMGEFAMSANRKGTLKVSNALLEVSRSAMFSRFDLSILGEHFTLDRRNGAFHQWLDLKNGKKLEIVAGHCKRKSGGAF